MMKINFVDMKTGEIRQLDFDRVRKYKDPIGKIKRTFKRFVRDARITPEDAVRFSFEIDTAGPREIFGNFKDFIKRMKEIL